MTQVYKAVGGIVAVGWEADDGKMHFSHSQHEAGAVGVSELMGVQQLFFWRCTPKPRDVTKVSISDDFPIELLPGLAPQDPLNKGLMAKVGSFAVVTYGGETLGYLVRARR
jgi:hypothetical protein